MKALDQSSHISMSPEYAQALRDYGPAHIANEIIGGQRQVLLGDESPLPYVRVNEGAGDRPVLYVPGFTEGIVAKAPFALALAGEGHEVILPDQNRKGIMRDYYGRKNAMLSQALNYIEVLKKESLDTTGSVDVVAHSMGSLVLQDMIIESIESGNRTFEKSNVVILAPSGTNDRESMPRLGGRFARHMVTEARTTKNFDDIRGEMLKAGTKNFLANVPRTFREMRELSKKRMIYGELQSYVGSVTVLSYAEDKLYPHKVLESMLARANESESGVAVATPISISDSRFGRDASHNDEQFNPTRVAQSVSQILKSS